MNLKLFWPALLLGLTLAFSCTKDDPIDPAGTGFLRVIHGIPDGGSMQVWMDGTLVGSINSYSLSTIFNQVDEGPHQVRMRPAGGNVDLINTSVTVDADRYYSLIVADSLHEIKPSVITEDPVPASGKSKINIYHLGTEVTNTTFTDSNSGAVISADRVFNDQLNNNQLAGYVEVAAGSFTIVARTPGTTGSDGIINTYTQSLLAGKSYTYIWRNPLTPGGIPPFTFIAN